MLRQLPADGERRVDPARLEGHGQQGRRRGLAVRAGDGHAAGPAHRGGEGLRPVQDRKSLGVRGPQLRVVVADRRRDDHRVRVVDQGRVVTDVHRRALRGQRVQEGRLPRVRPADRHALGQQDAGHTRHPGAADRHEVHPAEVLGGRNVGEEVEPGLRQGHGESPSPPTALARGDGSRRIRAVHHLGERVVGVPLADRRGRDAHREQPIAVTGERGDVVGDPLGGERRVVDDQPAAGGQHVGRVEPLLAVADRQRHVDRRQADGRELAHRVGAGPADHEVGGRVGQLHAVGVGNDDVRSPDVGPLRLELLARSGDVQHLDPGGAELGRARGERGVEPLRPQGSAGHEDGRPLRVQAERGHPLVPSSRAVELGDLTPQRHPEDGGVRQDGASERRRHERRHPRAHPVGQPGPGVLLVDDDRDRDAGGRRGRPASRRSLRSRRPPRRRSRRSLAGRPRPRPAAHPGAGAGPGRVDGATEPLARNAARSLAPGRAAPRARSRSRAP